MKDITLKGKRKDVVNMLLDTLLILEEENCSEDINITIPMSKYSSVVIEPADRTVCPMVNCNGRENSIQLIKAKKLLKEYVKVSPPIFTEDFAKLEDINKESIEFIGENL